MSTAIYPGTFDPITYGHIDVIKKSLKIFDKVVVAAAENINKDYLFSIEERVEIIKNSLFKDLKLNNIIVEAQRKKIKTIGELENLVKIALRSNDKTMLIAIYNNQNQRRYIGVKLD